MTDVVAIHGAFRGGWSWDLVRPILEAGGHRLFAPDLTGMGEGTALPRAEVSLAAWVDDVVRVAEEHDLVDLVLVGHSMGGVVAQVAAVPLAARLKRLVLLDAPLVENGQRAIDVSGPIPAQLPPRSTWIDPVPVGPAQGFDPDLGEWVNARLCATPFGPQLDECRISPDAVRLRTIAFCADTPPGYPSTIARERCDREGLPYVLLACGHDAPLLDPVAVAELLVSAG
jgi:pimeloyl-ACP methyl ester carboxylesterase